MKKLFKTALLAVAVSATASVAQASVITFDSVAAIGYNGGDTFTDGQFTLTALGDGYVGDISSPSTCSLLDCPIGNASNFYLGLNDGGVQVTHSSSLGFRLNSFAASFVAPVAQDIPFSVARILVMGHDLNNNDYSASFTLPGQNNDGRWTFTNFNFGASSVVFKDVSFLSCLTDDNGSCVAFGGNQAQFALDNINVAAVPEPEQWLMMLLGMAGVAAIARRKRSV
ncbi:PEP-CTERM sorting domain-containing protein [Chitinimonas arctica]|uniref:PEP-CTERM sorting domain-containing protein n=1 Tax=Chitinimonas arctica TaxID=2594795 RepID=A0A516SBS2_9NEIS|nr:NF038120 family PEP-CTERM protein [Chitinimonas arctica]QDQ25593.1 PEP-CTERM sorting domain-containing protein [Chitinimonas arctica]